MNPSKDPVETGKGKGDTPSVYPVFIIHSNWSVGRIQEFLNSFKSGRVGSLHVDYDREGNETNRTICIMENSVYDAVSQRYGPGSRGSKDDFSIARYHLRRGNYPAKNRTCDFYIPLANKTYGADVYRAKIVEKLAELESFGLIPPGMYRVNIPVNKGENPQGDVIRGSCFINFSYSVSRDVIAIIKVVIDNSILDIAGNSEFLRCFWARKKERKRVDVKKSRVHPDIPRPEVESKPELKPETKPDPSPEPLPEDN